MFGSSSVSAGHIARRTYHVQTSGFALPASAAQSDGNNQKLVVAGGGRIRTLLANSFSDIIPTIGKNDNQHCLCCLLGKKVDDS